MKKAVWGVGGGGRGLVGGFSRKKKIILSELTVYAFISTSYNFKYLSTQA